MTTSLLPEEFRLSLSSSHGFDLELGYASSVVWSSEEPDGFEWIFYRRFAFVAD